MRRSSRCGASHRGRNGRRSFCRRSLVTLRLISAFAPDLPRTRSFVFVDAIDEISGLLARTGHTIEAWQIVRNTNVIEVSGHSDVRGAPHQDVEVRDLRQFAQCVEQIL